MTKKYRSVQVPEKVLNRVDNAVHLGYGETRAGLIRQIVLDWLEDNKL